MADSTKLAPFNHKIDPKVLSSWKESVNHSQTLKEALEEALVNDTKRRKDKSSN